MSTEPKITKEELKGAGEYNKSAIVGLILSVISIFGIGLAGIAGLILGIVALVQIKHTQEKGKGLAIAAIASALYGVLLLVYCGD